MFNLNIFAVIGLGIKLLTKESGVQMLQDAKLLYPYWAPFKAGKLNFADLHKQGVLITLLKALQRTINTLVAVIDDKEADRDLIEVLESMPPV